MLLERKGISLSTTLTNLRLSRIRRRLVDLTPFKMLTPGRLILMPHPGQNLPMLGSQIQAPILGRNPPRIGGEDGDQEDLPLRGSLS